MEIKYFGHSCFLVSVSGKNLLFDPYISGNPLAKEIVVEEIEADYIFISHGHDDHIGDLIEIAKRTQAVVVATFEITNWLISKGVTNVYPMNIGGKRIFEFGKIQMTYAAHSSSLSDGTYAGLASGFMIEANGKVIYYSGDTALTQEMKLFGEMNQIDLALLPIGGNFTMDFEDAILASKFLKCNKIIGLHYNTFGYIMINENEVKSAFDQAEIELYLLKIGQGFTL